jgi:MFS family permease
LARTSDEVIWQAVLWNSVLWTAGNALTSGAFIGYFAQELGATGLMLGAISSVPELVGITGVAARPLLEKLCGYPRFWWFFSTISRVALLAIPAIAWFTPVDQYASARFGLLVALAVVHFAQGLAAVGYYAWLADLTPPARWGRFFAGRNAAVLLVQMVVPVIGGLLRDRWRATLPPESVGLPYGVVFAVGWCLLTASMIPMLRLPARRNSAEHSDSVPSPSKPPADLWSLRAILAHSWCLAAANGVTQVAFLKYQFGHLKIELTTYYLLVDLMLLAQLATTAWAGMAPLRFSHRRPLFWGCLLAAQALPFWMLATPETWWWLIPAYLCWGGFGAVNVAGPNLLLSLVGPHDTTTPLALFRQVAGAVAGILGLLGGWWLSTLLERATGDPSTTRDAYLLIFAVSYLGRLLAAGLVLRIPTESPGSNTSPTTVH